MDKRVNAGYTIIDSIKVGDTEFVLGEREFEPNRYVTWECKNGDDYFWGHYMDDYHVARHDLFQRVEIEMINNRADATRNPRSKEKER